jgi:hypothetical protein
MSATAPSPSLAIAPLAELVSGRVVLPGDPGWNDARQAFNVLVDQRPAAVVLAADADDVAATVRFARARGLRVAPQATAHNAGPLGALDGTILLNVAGLDEVTIDADAKRVRVGAGVKWERVTPALSELGLAALHGSSPDVGIAGYSVGGGMGWLARKHGLHTNAVTAFELVTADGRLVRTDAEHEPDLFWALRGGGGAFGVVTAIEFAVFAYPQLYAGAMFFPYERTREVLQAWNAWLPSLPDELMTWAAILRFPPLPELPDHLRGRSFTVVWGVHCGDEADGPGLMAPIRALGPAIDTFAVVPPGELGDLAMDPPDPLPFLATHHLLDDLPAAAIDALVDVAGPEADPAISMVQLRHMGGALGRVAPGAGARASLPGTVCLFALGVAPDAAVADATAAVLAAIDGVARPHRAGDYPNFVEHPADASAFFDEETWRRLRAIKALHDPDDVFRSNHPIPPAA